MENKDNQSDSVTKHILKTWLVPLLLLALITLVVFKCNRKVVVVPVNPLTTEQNRHNDSIRIYRLVSDKYILKIDSLKKLKPAIKWKIDWHYKTLHDTIPIDLRDDLDSLQSDWMELSLINLNVIGIQDSIIAVKDKEINQYKVITHNDSTEITRLNDSLPKAYKKGLRKGRKQGFVLGAVVIEGVNIGAKFKP